MGSERLGGLVGLGGFIARKIVIADLGFFSPVLDSAVSGLVAIGTSPVVDIAIRFFLRLWMEDGSCFLLDIVDCSFFSGKNECCLQGVDRPAVLSMSWE